MLGRIARWTLLALAVAFTSLAQAQGCNNRLVLFGDSLTDSGNTYAIFPVTSAPPFPSLIPDAPYASHRFSNGPTWAERLAGSLSSPDSGAPSFVARGVFTNYAVAGARARSGSGSFSDLSVQVSQFLSDFGGHACTTPTYVVWIGGDDLRDALAAALTQGPGAAGPTIAAAVTSIADNIVALASAGGRNFLILNAPDISHAPAIRQFGPPAIAGGALLSASFNAALANAIENPFAGLRVLLPQTHIARYDDNVLVSAIVADPAAFELSDVLDSCIRVGVIQGAYCEEPSEFLFWDGVHPTAAGHRIVAQAVRASAFRSRAD